MEIVLSLNIIVLLLLIFFGIGVLIGYNIRKRQE